MCTHVLLGLISGMRPSQELSLGPLPSRPRRPQAIVGTGEVHIVPSAHAAACSGTNAQSGPLFPLRMLHSYSGLLFRRRV